MEYLGVPISLNASEDCHLGAFCLDAFVYIDRAHLYQFHKYGDFPHYTPRGLFRHIYSHRSYILRVILFPYATVHTIKQMKIIKLMMHLKLETDNHSQH